MKKFIINYKKTILVCLFSMIMITSLLLINCNLYNKNNKNLIVEANKMNIESKRVLTEDELFNIFLNKNDELIIFLTKTFQIDKDNFVTHLKKDYNEMNILNEDNVELILIEYLLDLEDKENGLFDNTIIECNDSKEYMVALIKYFTEIYSNVDFSIACAIAQIESNYSASSMLNKNNIFGGMSNGSLIKYKNIEYGILRYIKLLNVGYFNKGLTTIETIGKVYNPTYNSNGVKIAKPSWVKNVTNALDEYANYDTFVDLSVLNSLKNVE